MITTFAISFLTISSRTDAFNLNLSLTLSHNRHLNPHEKIWMQSALELFTQPFSDKSFSALMEDRQADSFAYRDVQHKKHGLTFRPFKGEKKRQMRRWEPETLCGGSNGTFLMQFLIQVQKSQLIILHYPDVMALIQTVVKCWTHKGMQISVGQWISRSTFSHVIPIHTQWL